MVERNNIDNTIFSICYYYFVLYPIVLLITQNFCSFNSFRPAVYSSILYKRQLRFGNPVFSMLSMVQSEFVLNETQNYLVSDVYPVSSTAAMLNLLGGCKGVSYCVGC